MYECVWNAYQCTIIFLLPLVGRVDLPSVMRCVLTMYITIRW